MSDTPDLPATSDPEIRVTVPVEVVAALDLLCHERHIPRDEGIRRAIALWHHLATMQGQLAVVDDQERPMYLLDVQ